MKKFDAIIIGSGQAGTPLVFKLASEGQNVAFIEKEHFGGTCLNVGCNPTKAYIASARRMWEAQHGAELGIDIPQGAKVNLKEVKERKDALIKKSADSISDGVNKDEKITFYQGAASFRGPKTVAIKGEEITAAHIYINVGSRSVIPELFKNLPYLTNQSMLELEELPEHLIIIGGSYLGLEFGQMFRRFGSRVTIVEKGKSIIGSEDEDVSQAVQKFLEEEGISFRLDTHCISGRKNPDGGITVGVDCAQGQPEITGSHVLLAVGRQPNTDGLNLASASITTDSQGYIVVDEYLETSTPGIFALGDCNGQGAFTHTAYNDYEIIAENMFQGKDRKVSDRILTYSLFVDPPLGRAGMTKKEAIEKGYSVLEAYKLMDQIARAKEKGETKGFMRAIIDANTNKILGATVLGVGGDEIISGILNVMYADAPYTVIRDSVLPHPTVSELIPTMMESLKEIK